MSTVVVKDLFGQDIAVGDFVINAAAQYRAGVLRSGIVQDIGMRKARYSKHDVLTVSIKRVSVGYKRIHYETNTDQIVVLRPELLPQDTDLYKTLVEERDLIFKTLRPVVATVHFRHFFADQLGRRHRIRTR